jgi:hypothetical protein
MPQAPQLVDIFFRVCEGSDLMFNGRYSDWKRAKGLSNTKDYIDRGFESRNCGFIDSDVILDFVFFF